MRRDRVETFTLSDQELSILNGGNDTADILRSGDVSETPAFFDSRELRRCRLCGHSSRTTFPNCSKCDSIDTELL